MTNTTYDGFKSPATAAKSHPLVALFTATPLYIFVTALRAALRQATQR